MPEYATKYVLSMNDRANDALTWLCVETGKDRAFVIGYALAILTAGIKVVRSGKELRVFDPATGQYETLSDFVAKMEGGST